MCVDAFDDNDVELAKKILFSIPTSESKLRYISRQGPKKWLNNIQDMMEKLSEFSSSAGNEGPIFVARDLKKLPPISFEQVDVTSLLRKIQSVCDDVATIKSDVAVMKADKGHVRSGGPGHSGPLPMEQPSLILASRDSRTTVGRTACPSLGRWLALISSRSQARPAALIEMTMFYSL